MSASNSDLFPPIAAPMAASSVGAWWERLRVWFGGRPSLPFDHAVAALLIHAATRRGPASPIREHRIRSLLRDYFARDEAAVSALMRAARSEDERAVDLHQFARVVNRELSQEERLTVLAMAVEVAFADQAGADEEGFLRLLGGLLGISDHDRGIVQHRTRVRLHTLTPPPTETLHVKPRES